MSDVDTLRARAMELEAQRDDFARREWRAEKARREAEARERELRAALMNVTAVAVTMLFDTHRADVLRAFTVADLQAIVAASDHLRPQQVEDIYRRAWSLAAPSPAPAPESTKP